jgi:hypothetical protein
MLPDQRRRTCVRAEAAGSLGRGRIAVEAAPGAQPNEEGSPSVAESLLQLHWIVASVEDEQGLRILAGEVLNYAGNLGNGNDVGVRGRMHPPHVERGRPTVALEAELREPLVGPPRDDGLTRPVMRRMVVIATLGARLGVTTRPHAAVDGVNWLPADQRMTGQERAGHRRRPPRAVALRRSCPSRGDGPARSSGTPVTALARRSAAHRSARTTHRRDDQGSRRGRRGSGRGRDKTDVLFGPVRNARRQGALGAAGVVPTLSEPLRSSGAYSLWARIAGYPSRTVLS